MRITKSSRVSAFLVVMLMLINLVFIASPVQASTAPTKAPHLMNAPTPIVVTLVGIETAVAFCGQASRVVNALSITLPQGLLHILSNAFAICTGLIDISIPDLVANIDDSAFTNCTNLTSITFNSATTNIYPATETIPAGCFR